jgi:hypothetical protein
LVGQKMNTRFRIFLNRNNVIYYCVDTPHLPYKGVRGKGKVKIYEDVNHNIPIAEKIMVRYLGSLAHPIATSVMDTVRDGDSVILEITPSYYSTWSGLQVLRSPHRVLYNQLGVQTLYTWLELFLLLLLLLLC